MKFALTAVATISLLFIGAGCKSNDAFSQSGATLVLPVPSESVLLEEIFAIDESVDGPLLGTIGDQAFGADGQIYVSDYQSAQVHEYKADGHFVRSLGRQGDGPGEFQIASMLLTRGDTLYVQDNRLNRLSVFEQKTGEFIRSQGLMFDELRPYQMIGITDDAVVLTYSRPAPFGEAPADVQNDDIRLVPLVSGKIDSAPTIWRTPGITWKPIEVNGMKMLRNMPLSPASSCVFDADRGWCGYSTSLTFNSFSMNGDSLMTVKVEAEPKPVTEADREKILSRITNPALREQMILPDVHPAFAGKLLVDGSSRLWVRRGATEDGRTEYWIIDPEKGATKSVILADGVLLNAISGDRVVGRVSAADGQQSVRVYAVP